MPNNATDSASSNATDSSLLHAGTHYGICSHFIEGMPRCCDISRSDGCAPSDGACHLCHSADATVSTAEGNVISCDQCDVPLLGWTSDSGTMPNNSVPCSWITADGERYIRDAPECRGTHNSGQGLDTAEIIAIIFGTMLILAIAVAIALFYRLRSSRLWSSGQPRWWPSQMSRKPSFASRPTAKTLDDSSPASSSDSGTSSQQCDSTAQLEMVEIQPLNARSVESSGEFAIDATHIKLGPMLGSGASGRIFRARYLGSEVAVKELFFVHGGGGGNDSGQMGFLREFGHLKRLRHPNVVTLFGAVVAESRDAGPGAERFLLVTELARCSLRDVLNDSASLECPNGRLCTLRRRLAIAVQIAAGCAFVHSKGVVHFDIKPANLLLAFDGAIKICDLGIAQILQKGANRVTVTSTKGTPIYMSPEMLRQGSSTSASGGQGPKIGRAVDVYSFAIVLWEILHAPRAPYPRGWSPATLFVQVLEREHRPTIDPALVPPDVARLLQACWCANPSARPGFIEALRVCQRVLAAADAATRANRGVPASAAMAHAASETSNALLANSTKAGGAAYVTLRSLALNNAARAAALAADGKATGPHSSSRHAARETHDDCGLGVLNLSLSFIGGNDRSTGSRW